jgi:hypothetical protein
MRVGRDAFVARAGLKVAMATALSMLAAALAGCGSDHAPEAKRAGRTTAMMGRVGVEPTRDGL